MQAVMGRPDEPAPVSKGPNEKLRILLCTDWWDQSVNGVVASVRTLRRELERQGHEVRVLTIAKGLRSRRHGGVYRLGSISASIFYENARICYPVQDTIHRDILAWSPDVVHANSEFSTFTWAKRISRELGVPLVHTYHTIYEDYTHYYSPSHTMGRHVAATFSRHVLGSTDHVVVPTQKVATLLHSYGVTRPISVVPTGLRLGHFRPARTEAEHVDCQRLRRRLGIDPDRRVLVSVGRLAKEKNLDEVLDHLAALPRRDWTLLLVGEGPYRENLERHAHALGLDDHVVFTGCVDPRQVARYYRVGDAFVSASTSETQGLTFAEALACGLPLLCRRDPALRGILLDGSNGYGFDDGAEFAARLDDLFDDAVLRTRLAHNAARHAHRVCGSETFGAAVCDVYREAIARHRSYLLVA